MDKDRTWVIPFYHISQTVIVSYITVSLSLKRKFRRFDEIFITCWTGICQNVSAASDENFVKMMAHPFQ